jgi:hypothetical protein
VARITTRIVLVALVSTTTLMLLGLVYLDLPSTGSLLPQGREPDAILEWSGVVLTRELLRVSVLLGVLAALAFAAIILVDDAPRREFVDDQVIQLWEAVAAWSYYEADASNADVPDAVPSPEAADAAAARQEKQAGDPRSGD